MTDPTINHNTAGPHPQYEITVDGVRAGVATYQEIGDQRVFYDTQVDPVFGGRGLGTKLVAAALADTREAGKRIVPMCSFVADYAERHPEYAGIVDPITPEAEAAIAGTAGPAS